MCARVHVCLGDHTGQNDIMTTVLLLLQFVKHGSDLEKTKTKLLEAANYVDKVVTEKYKCNVFCYIGQK